jgi:hypothetical protein
VADQDVTIRWYKITIDGLEGEFVVCKLRRVSSQPVLVSNGSKSGISWKPGESRARTRRKS